MVRKTRNSAATMEPSEVRMFVTDNNNNNKAKANKTKAKAAPAPKKKATPRKQKQLQKKASQTKKVKSEPFLLTTTRIEPHPMDLSLPFATNANAAAVAKQANTTKMDNHYPGLQLPGTKTKAEIQALEAKVLHEQEASHTKEVDHFPVKLHKVLEAAEEMGYTEAICWHSSGKAFQILDRERVLAILHDFGFKHSKWDSFQRQLNHYQFHRAGKNPSGVALLGGNDDGKRGGIIYHDLFLRGQPLLAKGIKSIRKKRNARKKAAKDRKKSNSMKAICCETANEAVMQAGMQFNPKITSAVVGAAPLAASFARLPMAGTDERTFDLNRLSLLPLGLSSSVSAVLDYCNRFVPNVVEGTQSIQEEALHQAETEDALKMASVAPTLERHPSNLSLTGVIQSWGHSIPPPAMVTPEKHLVPITMKDASQVEEKDFFDTEALVAAASLIIARHEKMAVANMLSLRRANSNSMEPLPVESQVGSVSTTCAANSKAPGSLAAPAVVSIMGVANALEAESAWVADRSASLGGFSVANGCVAQMPRMNPQANLPAPASKPVVEKKENALEAPDLYKTASCGSTGRYHIDVGEFLNDTKNISITEDDQDDALSFDDFWEKPALYANTSIGSVEIDGDDGFRHAHTSMHPAFYTL